MKMRRKTGVFENSLFDRQWAFNKYDILALRRILVSALTYAYVHLIVTTDGTYIRDVIKL